MGGAIVNVSGKPARWGGIAARVAGWSALVIGLSVALLVGALAQAIAPHGIVGYVLGGLIGAGTLAVSTGLLIGGRSLEKSGEHTERAVQEQTLFGLAKTRSGIVTSVEAARALDMEVQDADRLLSDMAKRADGAFLLEVDDNGTLYYVLREQGDALHISDGPARPRVRVEPGEHDAEYPPPSSADDFTIDCNDRKAKGP